MMTDFEQQIGPFRLYSEIGRTPISNRYRATDGRSGQTVVLHLLTTESAQQPQLVEQFLTIGRHAMQLRHPGIVPVVDVGEAQGFVYIAAQWPRGQSLAERLRHTGRALDLETAAYILNALGASLDYAHSQGFIHGHITPDHIYITDDNLVMVDGFAEAVRVQAETAAQAGVLSDHPFSSPLVFISPFIAPEQAKSGQIFDFRADIYSLGAVLYTMLLGRPPFAAETPDELLLHIAEKSPPAPDTINSVLPAAMVYVMKLVLAKDPAARYASASEFANAFLQSSQWRATTPAEARTVTEERRGLAVTVLLPFVAVLSFLIISGAGLGWFGERFAFLPSTSDTGFIAQLRALVAPATVVAEPTAEPVALTPSVQATESATRLSTTELTQTVGVQVARTSSDTANTTLTATLTTELLTSTLVDSANSGAITATMASVTATVAPTLAASLAPTVTSPVTSPVTSSNAANGTVIIDPLGLLNGVVTAGDVIINGTAEPGAPIQLQVNGRNSGSTVTKSSGTWSLIIGLDQPGDYAIAAQMLDRGGNVTAVAQQTVTIVAAGDRPTAVVTATETAIATATTVVTPTATTLPPTATSTPTVRPTLTATNTAQPTATNSPTRQPTPTSSNTPVPTATNTVPPTATNTVAPTATNTPQPTATQTPPPTMTSTPQPTATNTPRPTVTNTPRPTVTNTPRPTATNTPRPTVTNTPAPPPTNTLRPTVTNTPQPTATNTPVPPPTNTLPPPTATNTPAPPTNTATPTMTDTPAPTPTPTAPAGSVEVLTPGNGESGNGQQLFTWSANFTPSEGYAFELVFWRPGQDPMANGFGMAAPTTNLNVTLDLVRLDEQLGALFDTGEYDWGLLLVRTTPAYERIKYLGGGRRFIYYRDGSPNSGGQSSGE